ncbi:hypothetical protein BB559_001204 [Furculomyces boomerangus]|uniref:GPI mannosyltransferase 1 n=1 Tax=Furculomyces boomerangus TaxID=61424 RepID=A0A2T9Z2P5_9FUNG|nr:hypothetical protein BB559_001204 [Furculomyces boomerangus]
MSSLKKNPAIPQKKTFLIRDVYIYGIALRIFMLVLGELMDRFGSTTYTDIDYYVFTDASRFLYNGYSPYDRSTYRYTPVLAMLLSPNIWAFSAFGKVLFSVCDVMVGYLIQKILEEKSLSTNTIKICLSFWLLNPIVANIPTRGSAEPLINFTIFLSFYYIIKKRLLLSAVFFGLAVHLKIYPIIYAIPILSVLDSDYSQTTKEGRDENSAEITKSLFNKYLNLAIKAFNYNRVFFSAVSGLTFLILNLLMYKM